MAPITLFISCPGAKSEQDVLETLTSTYCGNSSTPVSDIKFMIDKSKRAIAFVTVNTGPTFRPTRMDRLIRTLQDEADNERFRGERLIFQTNPAYIEWTIKIAKPQEEKEPRPAKFKPTLR
jgi:hypothetical protein